MVSFQKKIKNYLEKNYCIYNSSNNYHQAGNRFGSIFYNPGFPSFGRESSIFSSPGFSSFVCGDGKFSYTTEKFPHLAST